MHPREVGCCAQTRVTICCATMTMLKCCVAKLPTILSVYDSLLRRRWARGICPAPESFCRPLCSSRCSHFISAAADCCSRMVWSKHAYHVMNSSRMKKASSMSTGLDVTDDSRRNGIPRSAMKFATLASPRFLRSIALIQLRCLEVTES